MKTEKKKSSVFLYVFWLLTIIGLGYLSYRLYQTAIDMVIIPQKYIDYLVYGLLAVMGLTLLLALILRKSRGWKIFQSIMCILLSAAMLFASIKLPEFKGQFERMWTPIPDTGHVFPMRLRRPVRGITRSILTITTLTPR